DDGTLKLTPSGLTISGARIDGILRVAAGEQGRTRVNGEIAVDQASVGGLLAGLVAGAPRPMPVIAPAASIMADAGTAAPAIWSDQSFASEAFPRIDGTIKMRLARLGLAPGLTMSDARLAMTFSPGRIATLLEEAHGIGGAFAGEVTLDQAAAGVRVAGKLRANGIALAEIARAAGAGVAAGTAAASISFSGQALSPRALVASLEGSGRVTLDGARITGLTPEAVRSTAEAAFRRELTITEAALTGALREALKRGSLPLGARDIAVTFDDGAVKLERFQTTTAAGRVEGLVTVDLASLDAEAEWRITAKGDAAQRPDWPAVDVYYTGPLSRLSEIEPRIVLGTFERELTVRRMEREVEELERLRRLDEERARQERERQQALEAERQRRIEEERQRRLEPLPPPPQPPAAVNDGATAGRTTAGAVQPWPTPTTLPVQAPTASASGGTEPDGPAAGATASPPANDPLSDPAITAPRPRPVRPRPLPPPRDSSTIQFGPLAN
ncbi:MAG: AsmA-like C-terminal region-containing protein, partial [Hyphomicrobiaceae bacterium]